MVKFIVLEFLKWAWKLNILVRILGHMKYYCTISINSLWVWKF